eukprot:3498152-Amphidinium_carterae.2
MANPTRGALHRMERVGQHLKGIGRCVQRFERQGCFLFLSKHMLRATGCHADIERLTQSS